MDYTNEEGRRRTRTIEPYSLRRSRAGDVSLAAHDVQGGQIKYYRVDRISGAQALDQTFVPRHAIELSPATVPVATPMQHAGGQRRAFSLGGRSSRTGRRTKFVQCYYCNRRFPRATERREHSRLSLILRAKATGAPAGAARLSRYADSNSPNARRLSELRVVRLCCQQMRVGSLKSPVV